MIAGTFVALIGGCHLADWLNAPTIEVRNDTGAVLTDVRLEAHQLDAGARVTTVDSLGPGESISVSGAHGDYELELVSLRCDGPSSELAERRLRSRLRATPRNRSVFALDPRGRCRTVIWGGEWGRAAVPCTCPEGFADEVGDPACEVWLHAAR